MALLPVLTRVFAPGQYGTIDVVVIFVTFMTSFINLSLPSAIERFFYDSEYEARRREVVSTAFITVLLFASIVTLVGIQFTEDAARLLLESQQTAPFIKVGIIAAAIYGVQAIPAIVLRLQRRLVAFGTVRMSYPLVYGGSVLWLVVAARLELIDVFYCMLAGRAVQLVVASFHSRAWMGVTYSSEIIVKALKYSIPILPSVVVTWFNKQVDRVALLTFMGTVSVGVYGVGARIAAVVQMAASVFRQAWNPYAMSLLKESDAETRSEFYRRILNYYLGAGLAGGLMLIIFGSEILGLVAPSEYQEGYRVIPWLVGAGIMNGAAGVTSMGVLLSKRTIFNSGAAWAGALLNIILTVSLVPPFGIRGAAIGSFVGETVFAALLAVFSVKFSDVRFDVVKPLGALGIYVVVGVVVALGILPEVGDEYWFVKVVVLVVAIVGVGVLSGDKKVVEEVRRLAGSLAR